MTQGDIILSLGVPILRATNDEFPYFESGYTEEDVIVLTQACDMENRKTKSVTLCRIGTLNDALEKHFYDEHIKQNKTATDFDFSKIKQSTKRKFADRIRRGDVLDLYLLDKFKDGDLDFPYRVVYLRDSYRLPLETLEAVVENSDMPVLRLLPPYREHLSHNFSFNFARIGLPIDVKLEDDFF